jgi:hypothetical protein
VDYERAKNFLDNKKQTKGRRGRNPTSAEEKQEKLNATKQLLESK